MGIDAKRQVNEKNNFNKREICNGQELSKADWETWVGIYDMLICMLICNSVVRVYFPRKILYSET
jgi:hypothetical protein